MYTEETDLTDEQRDDIMQRFKAAIELDEQPGGSTSGETCWSAVDDVFNELVDAGMDEGTALDLQELAYEAADDTPWVEFAECD